LSTTCGGDFPSVPRTRSPISRRVWLAVR
jgi:hypothetical protein